MKNKISATLTFVILFLIFNINPLLSQNSSQNSSTISNKHFTISFSEKIRKISSIKLNIKKFNDDFLELEKKNPKEINNLLLTFKVSNKQKSVLFTDLEQVYTLNHESVGDANEELQLATQFSKKIKGDGTQEIEFKVEVKKVYQIVKDSHKINFRIVIRNLSNFPISIDSIDGKNGMEIGLVSTLEAKTIDDYAIVKKDGDFDSLLLGTDKIDKKWDGSIEYAGIMDKFYVSILKFKSIKPDYVSVKSFKNKNFDKDTGFPSNIRAVFPSINLESNEVRTYDFTFFVSQKSYKLLETYNFEEVSELNFLSLFIMKVLFMFYDLIHSWGMAIILLTLGIKLILHPLTMKQTKSMKQMQKIQPLMKDIQKKYKENPTKMNEEVMKLYRENNVNPLSGCLPLVIQIPILIALFTSLRSAVELRGESFLWVKDLSAADPFYIFPVLIVISMHYQQKQMNVDPNQAAAMKFMPLFMFFICLSLPSGVLVYWVVSNVLQIFQQGYEPTSKADKEKALKEIKVAVKKK
jgi:YidC/Oxa1 family membrane protein insertase